MSPLIAFIVLALCSTVICEHQKGLCNLDFCNCSQDAHPSWQVVNCTLDRNRKLDILEGDLPESTTDFVATGPGVIMFGYNSLSRLKDARRIYISGAEIVLLRANAARELDVLYLHLEIENCDLIRIEENTFQKIKGPLSVTIKNCESVSTEGPAFSWLLNMNMTDVTSLQLGPGAFKLDPTAGNVGEHGPGMSIHLKNISVPNIPHRAFGSSAAEIILDNVRINTIHAGSFSANTYNIVMALNSSVQNIDEDAFSQRSLINNLYFFGCRVQQLASRALQSAVGNLNISYTLIENIDTGAINITVATVAIRNTEFHKLKERSIELSSWNKLQLERNSFDELPPYTIVALDTTTHEQSAHELTFVENEIETAHPNSLQFIGQAQSHPAYNVVYKDNYYGKTCYCNITSWLSGVLDVDIESGEIYKTDSYCTVDEFLARCFNEPEQNIVFEKFEKGVCVKDSLTFHCESYVRKADGTATEIKNPRFPHKNKQEQGISERDKKVIGIVIVTCLGCVIIVMFVSFIKWMRRKGYCITVKNFLISSNSSCGSFCDRIFPCGASNGLDNARSISRLSVNEYSERHCLNEPTRIQEVHEVMPHNMQEEIVPSEDKTTQTLPEELTKELLDTLKERLENPENYLEARETIEHLYVLTKMEENQNEPNPPRLENIYELPFQNTTTRIGKNNKQMKSVGTETTPIEKHPQSPYNRQTALVHEYFEPKDLAVHLYAEIPNIDKEKRTLLSNMPDVVAEQAVPRGPYLRAVREKLNTPSAAHSSPAKSFNNSTIKSNASNTSAKMMNRPLPEKPTTLDPGEGTSFRLG